MTFIDSTQSINNTAGSIDTLSIPFSLWNFTGYSGVGR